MKHFIIDTLNVIHKSRELKQQLDRSKNIAVAAFVELLRNYSSKYPAYQFTIVIDGTSSGEVFNVPKIKAIYSGSDKTADELIKSIIANLKSKANHFVVSSDTEVHNFAAANGVSRTDANAFLNMIRSEPTASKNISSKQSKKEKPFSSSKKEINELKRLFESNKLNDEDVFL